MRRTLLLGAAALALAACDLDRRAPEPVAAFETLPFADELPASASKTDATGESTRYKSLREGERHLIARALVAETSPGASDAEMVAIVGVILNRWQSKRYGDSVASVLLHEHKGTWAFTCFDPRYSGAALWAPGVERSRRFALALGVVDRAWQAWRAGASEAHSFDSYFHAAAMKPKGSTPRWAKGRRVVKIGTASFVRVN